jgi:NADH-quinone oxidoreductase subunit L
MLRIPPARRPDDPLRQVLGPVFTLWENKYWVDELYWTVILNPYVALARFLAEVVDWRFWHDWFHDTILWHGYNRLSGFLAGAFDLGVIDGIANGLAGATVGFSGTLRRIQTGFVRNYALSVFLGVILLIGYLILR